MGIACACALRVQVRLSDATQLRRAEEEAEGLKQQQDEDEEEPPEIVISPGRSPLPSHATPPPATPGAEVEPTGADVEPVVLAGGATPAAAVAVAAATVSTVSAAQARAQAQVQAQAEGSGTDPALPKQRVETGLSHDHAVAKAANHEQGAAAATEQQRQTHGEGEAAAAAAVGAVGAAVAAGEAAAAAAAAATTAAAAAAVAAAVAAVAAEVVETVDEVGRDLGGGRGGDTQLERVLVDSENAAAEAHGDESAACSYSRHAWLLSSPVGLPPVPDSSATKQGASTLGRADGVPVDPPGLARKPWAAPSLGPESLD